MQSPKLLRVIGRVSSRVGVAMIAVRALAALLKWVGRWIIARLGTLRCQVASSLLSPLVVVVVVVVVVAAVVTMRVGSSNKNRRLL